MKLPRLQVWLWPSGRTGTGAAVFVAGGPPEAFARLWHAGSAQMHARDKIDERPGVCSMHLFLARTVRVSERNSWKGYASALHLTSWVRASPPDMRVQDRIRSLTEQSKTP